MILKILKFFFIALGVIFFILIIAVTGFIIFDPFNLRPLISMLLGSSEAGFVQKTTNGHPLLDEKQEKLLETIGVNVGNLPSEITPQMEDCFTRTLGEKRVKEIEAGDEPNLNDFLKSRECLE
jgi:hypothetical protein